MTREQKIEWLENASTEELVAQIFRTAEMTGIRKERYGSFSDETIEAVEEERLCKAELLKRLTK